MGTNPKTKAECDKMIAEEEKRLGTYQGFLVTKKKGDNVINLKNQIANQKARIKELKALRRSLPNK